MIKDFEPRLYQQTILAGAVDNNTLVVLPTGLGKTYIYLMLASHRLKLHPGSKVLLLGPTRPLIVQYYNLFLKHFETGKKMAVFTGQVEPDVRQTLWKESDIIFSTPQGLENDVISGRISLEDVSLLGFDEAHRAVGDYSYVWLAANYEKKSRFPRILALTASPGSDVEKIAQVCSNLRIRNVEIRTDSDPDVKQYIKKVDINWIYVELPEYFRQIQKHLLDCLNSKTALLKTYLGGNSRPLETKRDFLELQAWLLSDISKGEKNYESLKSLSVLAEAMKVQHALELLESQGISPLLGFMEGLVTKSKSTKVMAVKNLVSDLNFKSALILAGNLRASGIEHPKYAELKRLLEKQTGKTIIFSQYRDSISSLINEINKVPGVHAEMFVGQQKKKGTGMSQKQQIGLLEEFREGKFNVLVMSSVGEEGIDIPSVDLVVFYEPVPSVIRTIQRRGRTGRQDEGKVVVLVTRGTRDEAYRWSSFHKENKMHDILKELKTKFSPARKPEKTLSEFLLPESGLEICVDFREKGSPVMKKLLELGVNINLKRLDVADYLLSQDLCVEYKRIPDFVDSLLDKRLFTQLKAMKQYKKQLLVLEGTEDLYSQRNLNANAVRGMLSAVCLDFKVPILTTKNPEESALLMAAIAKREQDISGREFTFHSNKPLTLKEQQEYLISALPGIGPILSKPILKKFRSVAKIVNASLDELKEVDLIGDKKAAGIRQVLDSEYLDEN